MDFLTRIDSLPKEIVEQIEQVQSRELAIRDSLSKLKEKANAIKLAFRNPESVDDGKRLQAERFQLQYEELSLAHEKVRVANSVITHVADNPPKPPIIFKSQDELIQAKRDRVRIQGMLDTGSSENLSEDQKRLEDLNKKISSFAKNELELRQHKNLYRSLMNEFEKLQGVAIDLDQKILNQVSSLVSVF